MTTTPAPLTTADLDKMLNDDRWLGFGYLGGREIARQKGDDITAADQAALETANALGFDYEQLFEWANSKPGRWFADDMLGCDGRHADKYLPGKFQL